MKTKTNTLSITSIAPFVLFAAFAICIMSVLLMGTGLYQNQTERDRIGYQNRTAMQYITTRIRQSDKSDACFVSDLDNIKPQSTGNAFFFSETINGAEYYTCMYCYDGYLYELFTEAADSLDADAGQRVLEVGDVNFIDNGEMITVLITHTDGTVGKSAVYLRCAGENVS